MEILFIFEYIYILLKQWNRFSVELLAGAVYVVTHEWALGPELCDMWTSSDVLCCTASILHLVAIALDRSVIMIYTEREYRDAPRELKDYLNNIIVHRNPAVYMRIRI